jgi:hypothetical protein
VDVAFALLLTAAGAFRFLDRWQYTSYRIAREEGHRLYFKTAAAGALLFAAAFVLRYWAIQYPPVESFDGVLRGWIKPLLKESAGADAQASVIVVSFLAFVLGFAVPPILNLAPLGKSALWDVVKDDDLEALLYRAAVQGKPVSVTLPNAKVYVGFVIRTFDPRRDRKMFTMLPLVSGYRKDTGRVQFTTFYGQIYQRLAPESEASEASEDEHDPLAGVTPEDFRIVLPVDKALGVSLFDLRVYDSFQAAGSDPSTNDAAPRAGDQIEKDEG